MLATKTALAITEEVDGVVELVQPIDTASLPGAPHLNQNPELIVLL